MLNGEVDISLISTTISTITRDTVGGDGRVGYKSHTIQYSPQIVDIRGCGARHISRSKDIIHLYFFNVG